MNTSPRSRWAHIPPPKIYWMIPDVANDVNDIMRVIQDERITYIIDFRDDDEEVVQFNPQFLRNECARRYHASQILIETIDHEGEIDDNNASIWFPKVEYVIYRDLARILRELSPLFCKDLRRSKFYISIIQEEHRKMLFNRSCMFIQFKEELDNISIIPFGISPKDITP